MTTPTVSYKPFGSPSCCSSLPRESLSTLNFAALDIIKANAATAAFISDSSTNESTNY